MVWDTATNTVASVDNVPAMRLSAETANWIARELNAKRTSVEAKR
jgi:hypothetical protein